MIYWLYSIVWPHFLAKKEVSFDFKLFFVEKSKRNELLWYSGGEKKSKSATFTCFPFHGKSQRMFSHRNWNFDVKNYEIVGQMFGLKLRCLTNRIFVGLKLRQIFAKLVLLKIVIFNFNNTFAIKSIRWYIFRQKWKDTLTGFRRR